MVALTPAATRSPATRPPSSILKTSKLAVSDLTPLPSAGKKRKMDDPMELSSLASSSAPDSELGNPDESSPKKRPRVQFDTEVETRVFPSSQQSAIGDDVNEKSAAVVREEIRRAIQRHVSGGDSEAYDRIKEIFTIDPKRAVDDDGSALPYEVPSHTSLKRHLMGLLSNVSALDRNCSGLVHAVLSSEWLGRDESYVKLFIRFLGNLAVAQGSYLQPVLKMLVSYLGEIPKGTGRIPGYVTVHNSEIYARTHMALRHILQLIPAASGTLSPILAGQFPFETDSARANIAYTRNLIKMIEYAPELRADILALVTEKLVKIDVQIQIDMEDLEDEVGEDLVQELSAPVNMDDDDDDSDAGSDMSDDDSTDADLRRLKAVRDNIRKVDCMIDELFDFYTPPFLHGTNEEKRRALDLLLSHFHNIILPTYRSRHSQFLIFHFSQMSPDLVEQFVSSCIQVILNNTSTVMARQSAAAYLASFVARGAHVSASMAREVFQVLSAHVNELRRTYEETCRGPDLRRYALFYSSAQALLYIFCFRWRDLMITMDEDHDRDLDDLDTREVLFPPSVKETLHRAIYSKLNPLKVCSPPIVTEFARLARHLRFLYLFPLLEANKRLRVSSSTFRNLSSVLAADPRFGGSGGLVEREHRAGDDDVAGLHQLDAYFPFDPYQLPRSRRWLEGDYVEWRGIPGLDDRDEDDSENSDAGDDDDDEHGDDDGDDDDEFTGTDEE